jgi:hypothetical protein
MSEFLWILLLVGLSPEHPNVQRGKSLLNKCEFGGSFGMSFGGRLSRGQNFSHALLHLKIIIFTCPFGRELFQGIF